MSSEKVTVQVNPKQLPVDSFTDSDVARIATVRAAQMRAEAYEDFALMVAEDLAQFGDYVRKAVLLEKSVETRFVTAAVIAARPRAFVVRLPGGRIALTQTLKAPLAAQVSAYLVAGGPSRSAHTCVGEAYRTTGPGPAVEILAGTTRHAVVTVTRLRNS
ncbi:hypothetical protein ACWCPF_43645 [Streptomyces sp. NPDC001858]